MHGTSRPTRSSSRQSGACRTTNRGSLVGARVDIVARCALGDRSRRPAGARGLPLAAGRRGGPAEHQRVAARRRRPRGATPSPPSCRASSGTATPTAPRRDLRDGDRRAARRAARAGVRRQRLQRGAADAAADLRRRRPHASPRSSRRTRCTATSPASPAPPSSRASGAADFTLDLAEVAPGARPSRAGRSRSCARRTTPPAWSSRRRTSRAVLDAGARPGGGRRGLRRSSPTGRRSTWSTSDRPLVVTRTFSKTWSMAGAAPRLPRRPGLARRRARQGRAAVPPRRRQADRRPAGAAATSTRWTRGSQPIVAERERIAAALGRPAGRRVARAAPTSSCSGRGRAAAGRCGRRCSTAACSCATARRGRASTTACGSPSARRRRTTRSSPRSAEVLAMSRDRHRSRARRRRRRSSCRSTSTAPASPTSRTGHPVLRPHARPARPPRRLRPRRQGRRRPAHRHPPHRRGRRHRARRGVPRGARRQGGRAPLRQRAVPARRGAGRGRPRPVRAARSSCGRCELPECLPLGNPAFDPQLAEHAVASFATAAGITLHVDAACAGATCTTSSRRRSRAWPAACATRCGSRAAQRAVHEGRAVTRMASSRWSPCSTTASATCARRRRRCERLRRRRPAHRRPRPDRRRRRRSCCPASARSGRAWMRCARAGLEDAAHRAPSTSGRPFLGICVGMQMLFDASEEDPRRVGLGRHPRARSRWISAGRASGRRCSGTCSTLHVPTTRCSPASASGRGCTSCTRCTACPTIPAVVAATCEYGGDGQRRVPPRQRVRHPVPPGEVRRPRAWPLLANFVRSPSRGRRELMVELYPAIDLRGGQVVRLRQGDYADARPSTATTPSPSPGRSPTPARRGSTSSTSTPRAPGRRSTARSSRPSRAAVAGRAQVQTGGGVRTVADAQALADAGVARVVMGSAAVPRPVARRRGRRGRVAVAVGLDHRDGELAVHGWTEGERRAARRGARAGSPTRPRSSSPTSAATACSTGPTSTGSPRSPPRPTCPVIASGGVASLADIARARRRSPGIAGIITGKALYEGRFTVAGGAGGVCAGEGRAGHPVPRRHRRPGGQGHQLRRPARRRRPGRARRPLRRRGRRRAGLPRHHRVVRRPRHDGRRRAIAPPSRCSSRSPSAAASAPSTTPGGCCAPAPTRSASTPPRCSGRS